MAGPQEHVDALQRLAVEAETQMREIGAGLASLEAMLGRPAAFTMPEDQRGALAAVLRAQFGPLTGAQWNAVKAVLDGAAPAIPAAAGEGPAVQIRLTRADFDWAVRALGLTGNGYAKIRAVDEVESGGGWFTDVRADILALDGPGGFLDGPNLPKILFEAHWFDKLTGGRFRATNPNISSAKWNRALYVGGQAEYERLYRAMRLDEDAALKSASWGRYQIMGFNHEAAGFTNVDDFVAAMKRGERPQLEAFVAFIKSKKLAKALDRIDGTPANAEDFTAPYNGTGQVKVYSARIATAFRKFAA